MELITILGPTACGKTQIAAKLAHKIGGEIISADSRQVYRGMTIGTGKDYDDYIVEGTKIPCHLIDIAEPGSEYNIFQFQRGFVQAFSDILSRDRNPILCGGSGMYVESVIRKYELVEAPENTELRKALQSKTDSELEEILRTVKKLHNITDIETRERMLRAIEIEEFIKAYPEKKIQFPDFTPVVFGISYPRQIVRERITRRLQERLESGMIEEVQGLLNSGVTQEQLKKYGLEYKFITMFLLNEIDQTHMFTLLNTAIHQFAKRQMTWFRRMEKQGTQIIWIDPVLSLDKKVEFIIEVIKERQP